MTKAAHILYTLAEQADARYTAVIAARTGRDRWTMTPADEQIPEIRDAYRAKVTADEAWLTYCRTTGELAPPLAECPFTLSARPLTPAEAEANFSARQRRLF